MKLKIMAVLIILSMCIQVLPIGVTASGTPILGEIRIFAGNFAPVNWAFCDGSLLPIYGNETLFQPIGTTYGGDGETNFALPDLCGRVPVGTGTGPGLSTRILGEKAGAENVKLTTNQLPAHYHGVNVKVDTQGCGALKCDDTGTMPVPGNDSVFSQGLRNEKLYTNDMSAPTSETSDIMSIESTNVTFVGTSQVNGGSQPHDNMAPFLGMNYIISLYGISSSEGSGSFSNPYLGEIKMLAGDFAPKGTAICAGQLLPINQNQALFALFGTTYGGNGSTNFALPDLRGRSPMGVSNNINNKHVQGEVAGAEIVTLNTTQMPEHTHDASIATPIQNVTATGKMSFATGEGDSPSPVINAPAKGRRNERIYGTADASDTMKSGDVTANFTNYGTSATPSNISGGSQPHENMMLYLGITFVVCLSGIFPSEGSGGTNEAFVGEVSMFGFNFQPGAFVSCSSELLTITQNTALFAILGTTYGGNGQTNYALPDLQGRFPISFGQGSGLTERFLGESFGSETVTLFQSEIPSHSHGNFFATATLRLQ